jgi:hypothetical protein
MTVNKQTSKTEITMKETSENNGKSPAMLTLIACLGVLPLIYGVTGCSSDKATAYTGSSDLVGPQGPAGPAGPAGTQGQTGQTGAPGVALAGPTGAVGPAGPTGIRGPTGATGVAGAVEVGRAGIAGPAGPAGAQGETGLTGAQGASAAGYAGQTGAAGPAGAQGERGLTGDQGSTLVGPSGPAGVQGSTGVQGATGDTGLRGNTTAGVAGSTGASGTVGAQGATGLTGAQGETGVIAQWTSYRNFMFDADSDAVASSDAGKLSRIAAYIKLNPSLQLGIDTFKERSNQDLRNRRVNAVRLALINAGVPAEKIETGSFGDPLPRSNSRVEVLIATAPGYAAAQN